MNAVIDDVDMNNFKISFWYRIDKGKWKFLKLTLVEIIALYEAKKQEQKDGR